MDPDDQPALTSLLITAVSFSLVTLLHCNESIAVVLYLQPPQAANYKLTPNR